MSHKPTLPTPLAPFSLVITSERMNAFFDATAWAGARFGATERPESHPTIATCFRQGELAALKALGIELNGILHGEQVYKYHAPIAANVAYEGQTELAQYHEKSNTKGVTRFYVFRTSLVNTATREPAVECMSTLIYKGPAEL